jgi:hypothetical protein
VGGQIVLSTPYAARQQILCVAAESMVSSPVDLQACAEFHRFFRVEIEHLRDFTFFTFTAIEFSVAG